MNVLTLRRHLRSVALGGISAVRLAGSATAASLGQTPTSSGEYSARILEGKFSSPNGATAYELKATSLSSTDDDDDDAAPRGNVVGAAGPHAVAASGAEVAVDLDTLLAQPHAVVVSFGASEESVVACGEIGGQLWGDDDLIVGFAAVGASGTAVMASFDGDDDDQSVDVTVYAFSWS